jgi:predicted aconitase with swiveling domain
VNRQEVVVKCHKISEGKAAGEVLVSQDDILFYLVDPESGRVTEKGHSLEGKSIAGKILVFPAGKGSSSVQVDGLYQLLMQDNAPLAMIIERPDTILVTSAIIMEIPLVDQVEPAFYDLIKDGDRIEVDADNEQIIIL